MLWDGFCCIKWSSVILFIKIFFCIYQTSHFVFVAACLQTITSITNINSKSLLLDIFLLFFCAHKMPGPHPLLAQMRMKPFSKS